MTSISRMWIPVALCVMLATSASAQTAPGQGSAGKGHGGMRMGPHNTGGWAHMTKQERMEHQDKMRSMQSRGECMAYTEQHHAMMAERAKEKGRAMLGKPRHDACAALKK